MNHDKSLGSVLSETKAELKDFFETRIQIFTAEIKEKISAWKSAIPLLIAATLFALTAWITLTFALVALVRTWFLPSDYAWLWAGLIITVVYLVIGGIIGWLAYAEIKSVGMKPKRTLEVLKQDQVWIQNEARTA